MDTESGERDALPRSLERRRMELRLSKSEAARRAGVSRMAYWEWERGRRVPYDTNYAGIEDAMQWEPGSVEDLLRNGADPRPLETDPGLTEVANRMFTAIEETFKTWGVEMTPAMLEVWHSEIGRQVGLRKNSGTAPNTEGARSNEDS